MHLFITRWVRVPLHSLILGNVLLVGACGASSSTAAGDLALHGSDLSHSDVDLGHSDNADGGGPSDDLATHSTLSVVLTAPANGPQTAPFDIVAEVQGSEQVQSVTAMLDGQVLPLLVAGSANSYEVDSVKPTKDGQYVLVVTALGVKGGTATAQATIDYLANGPTLTVVAPLVDDVALPSLHIDATCNSAVPGCTITALLAGCNGAPYATGVDHLTADILVDPAYDDTALCLEAVDAAGHKLDVSRRIRAEKSTAWQRVYDAAEEILDFNLEQPTRQLVRADRGWPTTYSATTVVDETQPMPAMLESGSAPAIEVVDLFTRGKDQLFVSSSGSGLWAHSEDSSITTFGPMSSPQHLPGVVTAAPKIHGDYAAFIGSGQGETYQFSQPYNGVDFVGCAQSIDVGANGVVAFTTPTVTTPALTPKASEPVSCGAGGLLSFGGNVLASSDFRSNVITDGQSVVYTSMNDDDLADYLRVGIWNGSQESLVTRPSPGITVFGFNNGWLAYFVPNPNAGQGSNYAAVWRRSPAGVESMLADLLDYPIAVEAVGFDGSFVYDAGSRRFIADVAGISHDVGAVHGKVVWNGSGWTVALGRSLFNIVP